MDEHEHDQEYSLVEPLFVDDGQLDNVQPHECFVLGVEWQTVYAQVQTGEAFQRPVHTLNRSRLMSLLVRNGRKFTMSKDADGWCSLEVENE